VGAAILALIDIILQLIADTGFPGATRQFTALLPVDCDLSHKTETKDTAMSGLPVD
jgi:hypothetical protein